MSAEASVWAYHQQTGDPVSKLVLILLGDFCEGVDFTWATNLASLSNVAEVWPAVIQHSLDGLVEKGLIYPVRIEWDGQSREGYQLAIHPGDVQFEEHTP